MNFTQNRSLESLSNRLEGELLSESLNGLLTSFPEETKQCLFPHFQMVYLKAGLHLWNAFEPITKVYFPNKALISLLSTMQNGATTEIVCVGHEGMVGLPVILGGQSCPYEAVVQIEGWALSLDSQILKSEFESKRFLNQSLLLYTQARFTETAQIAAANRQCSIKQNLARWLLIASDKTLSNELSITHELIAHALGIRRSGVTVALKELHKTGIIHCFRRKIIIMERKELEKQAGDPYSLINQEYLRLLS